MEGKCANFHDEATFPPFRELPEKNTTFLSEFYDTADGTTFTPDKHWCFLAEIASAQLFDRLVLTVRDSAKRLTPVAFHTADRGTKFRSSARAGHTIAVLYPHQHEFADTQTTGIRQEDEGAVKIFPFDRETLIRLGDCVNAYSTMTGSKRKCHGCGKVGGELFLKCSRCGIFWYCDKRCQLTGWKDKGHKDDCKKLRDADLQAMFRMDWNDFQSFAKFPMRAERE